MRQLLLIFFALTLLSCSTHKRPGKNETFHFFTFRDKIDWTKYDRSISDNDKELYAQKIKDQFSYFFNEQAITGEGHTLKDFINKLHFIDLNGDKNLDIIYEGWSGSESDNTQIFINKNGHITKVFEAFQYIESLDFDKNEKLISFTILDFGCCAEYIEYETKFSVTDNFETSILLQRAKPSFTTPPQVLFSEPVKFTTISDEYTLRSSPIIDDTSTVIYDAPNKGNAIAKFSKNSSGQAWAEQKDNTGRTWWLVEMNPIEKLSYNLVYYKDTIPPREIGWMSKRYLGSGKE